MQFPRKSMYEQYLATALGRAWNKRLSALFKCPISNFSDIDCEEFDVAESNYEKVYRHYRLTGENPILIDEEFGSQM